MYMYKVNCKLDSNSFFKYIAYTVEHIHQNISIYQNISIWVYNNLSNLNMFNRNVQLSQLYNLYVWRKYANERNCITYKFSGNMHITAIV